MRRKPPNLILDVDQTQKKKVRGAPSSAFNYDPDINDCVPVRKEGEFLVGGNFGAFKDEKSCEAVCEKNPKKQCTKDDFENKFEVGDRVQSGQGRHFTFLTCEEETFDHDSECEYRCYWDNKDQKSLGAATCDDGTWVHDNADEAEISNCSDPDGLFKAGSSDGLLE